MINTFQIRLETFDLEIFPLNFDAAAVVDLKSDATLSLADEFVIEIDHRFAVEPALDVVAFNAQTECVPLAFFENVFFLVGYHLKPAATVRFVDTAGVVAFGCYFTLPAVYDCGLFDK